MNAINSPKIHKIANSSVHEFAKMGYTFFPTPPPFFKKLANPPKIIKIFGVFDPNVGQNKFEGLKKCGQNGHLMAQKGHIHNHIHAPHNEVLYVV